MISEKKRDLKVILFWECWNHDSHLFKKIKMDMDFMFRVFDCIKQELNNENN